LDNVRVIVLFEKFLLEIERKYYQLLEAFGACTVPLTLSLLLEGIKVGFKDGLGWAWGPGKT